MNVKCEKCGHDNSVQTSRVVLMVEPNWESALPAQLVADLKKQKFSSLDSDEHQTLFFSTVMRLSLLDPQVELKAIFWSTEPSPEFTQFLESRLAAHYAAKLAPELAKLQGFEVLGYFTLPSRVQLAVTDLTYPWALFCFPVVKKTHDLEQKLEALGLKVGPEAEGLVSTLDDPPLKTVLE